MSTTECRPVVVALRSPHNITARTHRNSLFNTIQATWVCYGSGLYNENITGNLKILFNIFQRINHQYWILNKNHHIFSGFDTRDITYI